MTVRPKPLPGVDEKALADIHEVENPFEQFDEKRGFGKARLKLVNLLIKWTMDPTNPKKLASLVKAVRADRFGASDTASREALAYWAGRLGGPEVEEKLWSAL